MPQISPINWILICLLFFVVTLSIMTSLPTFHLKAPYRTSLKSYTKPFSW